MCGILGGNRKNWNYQSALDSMHHRGPDAQKITIVSSAITMGFNRLSIIDLSDKGMQPMTSRDGRVTITFNGEIYRYNKLRQELENKGYVFETKSDTEVLLNAYLEWREKFLEHIDGMFAVAIYDKNKEQLLLARDRAGIKPLYWYFDNGRFAYASELKGIESLLTDTELSIDATALYDYYNYLYIPDPKTIFTKVHKLEAAHILVFDITAEKIVKYEKYWELKVNELEGTAGCSEDLCEQIREKIQMAVASQMVADVPVGAFLSGGIDSSVLCIEALKIKPKMNMFSMGFYDFETNELPYVECLERYLGFESQKYLVGKDEFETLLFDMKKWYDEPFCDTSAYPTYIVSKNAREVCKVVLSGDGGDEIFGGYTRYALYNKYLKEKKRNIEEELKFLWNIHLYSPKPARGVLKKQLGIPKDYDTVWFYRKYYRADLPPVTRLQYMDFYTYLPCDVLTKTDRVSMAVSLEARVPFLDKDLLEFAFSLTQNERCPNGELKGIVKKAYEDILPHNLLYRMKWGFSVPTNFVGYGVNPQERLENEVFQYRKRIK